MYSCTGLTALPSTETTRHLKCLQGIFDKVLNDKEKEEMRLSLVVVNERKVELRLGNRPVGEKYSTKEGLATTRANIDDFIYRTFGAPGIEFGEAAK